MTPEVESILEGIGWEFAARCDPAQTVEWLNIFTEAAAGRAAGRIASSPQEAKALSVKVGQILRMARNLAQELEQLPEPVRRVMNCLSTLPSEQVEFWSKDEFPDHISWTVKELLDLIPGIDVTKYILDQHGKRAKRGGQRNEIAFTIAKGVAEIYVVGLGIRPTVGRRGDNDGVSGRYGRTVEKVLAVMGLSVGDAHDQCKEAVDLYDAGHMNALLLLRCPVTRDRAKAFLAKER